MIIYLSSKKNPPIPSPAISVIIPVYNTEKYIGECLDSLLAQTFQNFEVIVVDDCSTDSSVKIAEDYVPKFNGRLKISRTKKNSGSGGQPRNIGLTSASGEYVYFMDADDFILLTALETLYEEAKKYKAEVVYMSDFYCLNQPNEIRTITDNEGMKLLKTGLEDKPKLTEGNTDKILRYTLMKDYFRTPWTKFFQREFLLRNKITFPEINVGEDALWTIRVCAYSKRFLRLPQPLYFYRSYNENSVTHKKRAPQEQALYWTKGFVDWSKYFNGLMNEISFLKENPTLCYQALKDYLDFSTSLSLEVKGDLNATELYDTLRKSFVDENTSLNFILPLLFARHYESRQYTAKLRQQIESQAQFNKFKLYFTARIDVKLLSKTSDFKILSVSDEKASITKPAWFQDNGIGYVITSCVGRLDFIAKTTVDGQVLLYLRGSDVRDPQDNTKRIPYWIDYTKLTVNDKPIFDTLTPAWHDKFYTHSFEIKAGEEIKVQVEWLPHRSDT